MTDEDAEVRNFAVHPALWPHLVAWLDSRGIDLVEVPADEEPFWIARPRSLSR